MIGVDITRESNFGIITLNNPSIHNALKIIDIELIRSTLQEWKKCNLSAILITGSGKSFCSGLFINELENKTWIEIISRKKNKDITPYSLRHRFAHQCHKGSGIPISIKDAAAAMGLSVKTHMNSYGSYTDELAVEKEFERHAENRIEA